MIIANAMVISLPLLPGRSNCQQPSGGRLESSTRSGPAPSGGSMSAPAYTTMLRLRGWSIAEIARFISRGKSAVQARLNLLARRAEDSL